MKLLDNVLSADPSSPRLTIYNEATGSRLDFSAFTLDNWAAKVGNMLVEEFDLAPGNRIAIYLAPSWQASVIALGALAAGVDVTFEAEPADVLFTDIHTAEQFTESDETDITDIAVVSDDPFGRGLAELGLQLPEGCVDFSPTVRFYGDHFLGDTPALRDLIAPELLKFSPGARVLSTGWSNWEGFVAAVLAPIACTGSAVVVTGPVSTERLDKIVTAEGVTERL